MPSLSDLVAPLVLASLVLHGLLVHAGCRGAPGLVGHIVSLLLVDGRREGAVFVEVLPFFLLLLGDFLLQKLLLSLHLVSNSFKLF